MSVRRANSAESVNVGEALFEAYLRERGLHYAREAQYVRPAGAKTWPDFAVDVVGSTAYCEVKEFHAGSGCPAGAVMIDPYRHIRKAIEKARTQFRGYQGNCVVLVLHNVDDWAFSDRPYILFGAMLGDAGVRIPVNVRTGRAARSGARSVFLGNGRMVAPDGKRPQNTTISAIAVLSECTVPNPEFEAEYRRRVLEDSASNRGGDRASRWLDTRIRLYDVLPVTLGVVPRVCAFENPFSTVQLPASLFHGPYDAVFRYSTGAGRIERCYAGAELLKHERLEANRDVLAKVDSFAEAVVRRFKPEQIVLFGSHASGTAKPDSDVDLLIVFPGDGDESHRSLDIRRRCNPEFALDLLTCSAGELARRIGRGDGFYKAIMKQGKTLRP